MESPSYGEAQRPPSQISTSFHLGKPKSRGGGREDGGRVRSLPSTQVRRIPGPKETSEGAGKAINLRGEGRGSEQVTLI